MEKITVPTEKITVPMKKITVPTEKITVPTEKITVPTEKITVPTEKITVPMAQSQKREEFIQRPSFFKRANRRFSYTYLQFTDGENRDPQILATLIPQLFEDRHVTPRNVNTRVSIDQIHDSKSDRL
jgi:hypothetical protein